MKPSQILASAFFAVLLPVAPAMAAPLIFDGFALGSGIQTNNVINGTAENPLTGEWSLRYGGTVVNGQYMGGQSYQSYCVEPLQALRFTDIYNQFTWRTLGSEPGNYVDSQATRINKLYTSSYALSQESTVNSAAFQLALWEILYDTDLNLGSGQFKTVAGSNPGDTPADVLAEANAMLLGLDARNLGQWDFYVLNNPLIQDQLVALPALQQADVPLPGSLMLLSLGLAGLVLRRRKSAAASSTMLPLCGEACVAA